MADSKHRTIGIVIFPDVEELDFIGPYEIFAYLRELQPDLCDVFTVSQYGGEVRCRKGLRVIADYSIDDAPDPDVVLVPGGQGTRIEVDNSTLIGYLAKAASKAELTTSVCTGAFLLQRTGVLNGRRATTHWASLDRLRALGTVDVLEQRFVDDGSIVSSAGISAGIDMSLYLVGRLWGPEMARRVQKGVEYFPDPPYGDVPIPAM